MTQDQKSDSEKHPKQSKMQKVRQHADSCACVYTIKCTLLFHSDSTVLVCTGSLGEHSCQAEAICSGEASSSRTRVHSKCWCCHFSSLVIWFTQVLFSFRAQPFWVNQLKYSLRCVCRRLVLVCQNYVIWWMSVIETWSDVDWGWCCIVYH